MLAPQEPWKDRLGAQQGLGRGATKRGELTQAFRELDPKASCFTGALGKQHQLARKRKWNVCQDGCDGQRASPRRTAT